MKLAGRGEEEVQRIGEEELSVALAVEKDARQTWRPHIPQVAVLTIQPLGEVQVLEVVYRRVGIDRDGIAQSRVYAEHLHIAWHATVHNGAVTLDTAVAYQPLLVEGGNTPPYVGLLVHHLLGIKAMAYAQCYDDGG